MDKLIDFLQSFVSKHLARFDGNRHFPVTEFLALLFKFTFLQTRLDSYFSCLETWSVCIEYVATAVATKKSGKDSILPHYRQAFQALATEVIKRIQLKHYRYHLEALDNETLDDDVRHISRKRY